MTKTASGFVGDEEKSNTVTETYAYDSYGLSMIFVWIGRFGNLIVSNTRWNHMANYAPGHGVDSALN